MDDLHELQSRVAAARQRLTQIAEEDRRYTRCLDEIIAIVEGSMARYKADLERLRAETERVATERRILRAENDAAKNALIQAGELANSLQARVQQREGQNEKLRQLLMELLGAIEADERPALAELLRRLESGVRSLLERERLEPVGPEAPNEAPALAAADTEMADETTIPAPEQAIEMIEEAEESGPPDTPDAPEIQVPAERVAIEAEGDPEAIGEIDLVDSDAIVIDPAEEAAANDSTSVAEIERAMASMRKVAGAAH